MSETDPFLPELLSVILFDRSNSDPDLDSRWLAILRVSPRKLIKSSPLLRGFNSAGFGVQPKNWHL